jgi:hypothetical protein
VIAAPFATRVISICLLDPSFQNRSAGDGAQTPGAPSGVVDAERELVLTEILAA